MPGAVRAHPPREQRPQHGARVSAHARVPGGSGAGDRRGRASAGCELLVGRRPSFWAGRPRAGG
eukprot:3325458-Alexandrium_andersonii.AAC.1